MEVLNDIWDYFVSNSAVIQSIQDLLVILGLFLLSIQALTNTYASYSEPKRTPLLWFILILILTCVNGYAWDIIDNLTDSNLLTLRLVTMTPLIYFTWRLVLDNQINSLINSVVCDKNINISGNNH